MIEIFKLSKQEWSEISEKAHAACFNEVKPKEWDRIDFALVGVDKVKNQMINFVTMREVDHETIYWQYGGSFPEYKGSLLAARSYAMAIKWCEGSYKRMVTLIENTNKSMLKLAAFNGLLVIGVRNFKGKVLLEHGIEFRA
jgi:hypothetical protein